MSSSSRRLATVFLAAALAAVVGCDAAPTVPVLPVHDHPEFAVNAQAVPALPQLGTLLQQVRSATARYNSTTQATRAGYESSPCVAVPGLGGMGFHWLNESLVDPVFDPLQPEAILYEEAENGQMRPVAVEYIVIDAGQDAPTFAGHPFDVGGTPVPVPHWSLHVWLHKENPNGMFTPFNPNVSCL
jgi:hypothetical protein